jgi:hypothetical protein
VTRSNPRENAAADCASLLNITGPAFEMDDPDGSYNGLICTRLDLVYLAAGQRPAVRQDGAFHTVGGYANALF